MKRSERSRDFRRGSTDNTPLLSQGDIARFRAYQRKPVGRSGPRVGSGITDGELQRAIEIAKRRFSPEGRSDETGQRGPA